MAKKKEDVVIAQTVSEPQLVTVSVAARMVGQSIKVPYVVLDTLPESFKIRNLRLDSTMQLPSAVVEWLRGDYRYRDFFTVVSEKTQPTAAQPTEQTQPEDTINE
jgi:hypothetical protein